VSAKQHFLDETAAKIGQCQDEAADEAQHDDLAAAPATGMVTPEQQSVDAPGQDREDGLVGLALANMSSRKNRPDAMEKSAAADLRNELKQTLLHRHQGWHGWQVADLLDFSCLSRQASWRANKQAIISTE
jgi:hypothetical protein